MISADEGIGKQCTVTELQNNLTIAKNVRDSAVTVKQRPHEERLTSGCTSMAQLLSAVHKGQ